MNILIIGGTGFVGRHLVVAALARSHSVTLFNRGQTGGNLFPQVETIVGDRETDIHRLSGRLAFIASLPVAYHCLWSLGFQDTDTRVLAHSLAGCAFYGAFAAKVTIVRSKGLPGAALPVAGGLMFAVLVLAWYTSALWFINEQGFPDL